MMFSVFPSALPHIKSRRLTALAVTSTERSKTLLDLPSVAESGLLSVVELARRAWMRFIEQFVEPGAGRRLRRVSTIWGMVRDRLIC